MFFEDLRVGDLVRWYASSEWGLVLREAYSIDRFGPLYIDVQQLVSGGATVICIASTDWFVVKGFALCARIGDSEH